MFFGCLEQAAAVTILAAVIVIGVAVAGRIINCQQQFPEIQADVPEIPAPVPALPIIPEVQGNGTLLLVFCGNQRCVMAMADFL